MTDRVIHLPRCLQILLYHFFTASIHEISVEKKFHVIWSWLTWCPRHHLVSMHFWAINIGKMGNNRKMTFSLVFFWNFHPSCLEMSSLIAKKRSSLKFCFSIVTLAYHQMPEMLQNDQNSRFRGIFGLYQWSTFDQILAINYFEATRDHVFC